MSEDKKTIVKMAHIYTQEGRWEKAINEYKKLLKLDPEDFNTYSVLGDAYVKKGDIQPAFDAYLVCSDAYVRLGQLEKAALAQSKIARLDPAQLNDAAKGKQAVFQKQVDGDKAMEAGEFDKAIEAYQDVLKLDRDRFDLYQKLGDLYVRKGDTEQACAKYIEIGNIYFSNKLYKKAAPIFLKVVELDPEQVDAHAALAEIQAKSGNESEAKKELINLTEFLFQRGDYDRAYQFAKRAETLKAIESYNYIGHVLMRRGMADEAKGWFEKLLKFKLNHAGALWGMGLWHLEKGQLDEAEKCMTKVPSNERFYGETQVSLGSVYEKMNKPGEASAAYAAGAAALKEKGLSTQAKEAEEKAKSLKPAEASAAAAPTPEAAPQPAASVPEVAPPAAAPAPAPPALTKTSEAPPATLPPLPVAPAAPAPVVEATAPNPEEEIATLVALAESQEEEGDFDGALNLYQNLVNQYPSDPRGKAGLTRVYAKVGQGAIPTAPAGPSEDELAQLAKKKAEAEAAQLKAESEAKRVAEIEARQKAEADAKRQAEESAKQVDEMRKKMEAEIRAQLEAQMRKEMEDEMRKAADVELNKKMETEKLAAEAEAKAQAEKEIREQFEAERKKLENQKAAEKQRMEDELRARLTAEIQQKKDQEAKQKLDAIRAREEEENRKKIQVDVLARVQAQQKEKLAPLQRTIEEIRKKVEEQAAASAAAVKDSGAPSAAEAPAPEPKAAPKVQIPVAAPAKAEEEHDDMDPFMNAAVADIYVKQGLVKEAVRIYEKILKLDPGNTEIRNKLDVAQGRTPAAPVAKPAESAAKPTAPQAAPNAGGTPTKKSKVSYL